MFMCGSPILRAAGDGLRSSMVSASLGENAAHRQTEATPPVPPHHPRACKTTAFKDIDFSESLTWSSDALNHREASRPA